MKQNGFRLKALVGAMLSTSLLLGANSAFAERATFSAPGAFNSANNIAVSSGSDALGDTLLFPYYTNENGNSTLLHIVNTSKTDTVIAKVRFRDFATSADGIDFTVILSPEDVFSGTLNKLASGANAFKRSGDDNTCTSPLATNGEYTDPLQFSSDTDHSGHVEVITLASFNENDYGQAFTNEGKDVLKEIADLALHSKDADHEPAGCSTIDKYFNSQKDNQGRFIGLLQDALDDVEIRSHLFGQFAILNIGSGVEAGGRPVTIANAYRAVDANGDGDYTDSEDKALHSPCWMGTGDVATNGNSIICGQFPIHYPYPHLGHVVGVDVTGTMTPTKVASNVANFNHFQDTIRAIGMGNEWSVKASNGVLSEMIFTFPTKYVFNDVKEMKVIGGINDQDMTSEEVFTGASTITVDNLFWDDVDTALNGTSSATSTSGGGYFDDATGCVAKTNDVLNRDEGRSISISNTSVSGAANPDTIEEGLCNEVTAVTYVTEDRQAGDGVTQKALDSNGNPNPVIRNADSTGIFQEFGWMKVTIKNENGQMGIGLPMIGYSMWQRTFNNNAAASYGHLMDNVKFK
jgi:hypothetical protein